MHGFFEISCLITAAVCANIFPRILLLRLHQETIIYDTWAVFLYPCLSQLYTCIQCKFQSVLIDYEQKCK